MVDKIKIGQIFGGYYLWREHAARIVHPKNYPSRCEYTVVTYNDQTADTNDTEFYFTNKAALSLLNDLELVTDAQSAGLFADVPVRRSAEQS